MLANKEQMPEILRFMDVKSLELQEAFVGFAVCAEGTSGAALASTLLNQLYAWNLPDLSSL